MIDLGTGDGLFVYQSARENPRKFYIGIDPSPRPLEKISEKIHRKAEKGGLPNALFLQASLEDLPRELDGAFVDRFEVVRDFAHASVEGGQRFELGLQGIEDPRARVTPNVAPGTVLTRGAWHRWEFVLTCNSGLNTPDGTIDFWLDGKHVTTVSNVNWTQTKHPTRACDFPIFHWSPTYGGGGASPGADQYLWFDRVYVSGR